MTIIPPRVLAAEQSNRIDYLEEVKQKRCACKERRVHSEAAYFQSPNGYSSALAKYGDVKEPYPEVGTLSHTPTIALLVPSVCPALPFCKFLLKCPTPL